MASGYRKPTSSSGPRKKAVPKMELNEEQKQEIKEAFDLFDTDGTGTIDVKELKVGSWSNRDGRTCLSEMIDEADQDGDGEINEMDFMKIMKKTNLY
ncbi:centrin-1-like [Notothenia coriiceps]|uniref:Centrin-1-like n=1 Tax=Notothenia coriiceps TaxID=8208 RepID=A0A6I9NZZ2_9TELE|nr:PREDICTED: centrin-1-like [Notothenia coriiceps]